LHQWAILTIFAPNMMTMRRLCWIGLAFLLGACQRETQLQKANREKILLVGNSSEPKALDLQLVTSVVENKVLSSLFEGLVADHPTSDTEMLPGVAEKWEHNEDYTRWVFHLRQNAKWSDGEALTAHDFAFSYHRMLHPEFPSPYCEMLYFLKNAKEYKMGEVKDFAEVGVKVIDDFTLELTMKEPVPYLPGVTRHFTWFPVPKHAVLSYGKMTEQFTPWTAVGNLVCNGPFVLKSWQLNDHIEVTKNPMYWDVANVKLNGIRFLPVENAYTEARAFLAGQLHTTYRVPVDLIPYMQKNHPDFLKMEPYIGSQFLRVNINRPGLSDVRVRKALSLAIDAEAICKTIQRGYEPATSFSPKLGEFNPEPVITFDPEKARALLAEAGYPAGKGFPRYSILISGGGGRNLSEAIQAMWKEHLGIVVDIRTMDFASYIDTQNKLDYDISSAGWVGDYLDPTTFLLMWTKGNGNNNTGWHSEEYERLLSEAANSADPSQRMRVFEKAEKLLMEERPILPFAWQARNYLHHPSVKGWNPLLLDNHPWKDISLEETD
jgi:oligopeptide transport system substrate-binding protein